MAHLVTGYAGKAHIKSSDDGAFNAAFFGAGQYVLDSGNDNCFSGSIINNNTVRILDGEGLMYGRHFRIEPNAYEDVAIETGTTGTNRIDIICMTYEKNTEDETETVYLEVIKGTEATGTAAAPTFENGNILKGAFKNQMPLYKVTIKGVVLSKIEPMFAKLLNYEKMAGVYLQKHENLDEKYYQQFEQRIEESVDEMTEIPKVVLAQVELNTAKIDKLKNIGNDYQTEQFDIEQKVTTFEETKIYTFDNSFDGKLEENAIYAWMLRMSPRYSTSGNFVFENVVGSGITNINNVGGFVDVVLYNRFGAVLSCQRCPLIASDLNTLKFDIDVLLQGFFMCPLKSGSLYLNSFSGCYITVEPYIYEKKMTNDNYQGVEWWSFNEINTNLNCNLDLKLEAVKTGYDVSKLPNGGELPEVTEGTNDYEELENKPTINGVEITGDLTLEDLGIESGGGASSLTDLGVEATAEELNYMTNVTSDVQSQLNDKDNRLKTLENTAIFTDTEPETVAENTIVYVYETE